MNKHKKHPDARPNPIEGHCDDYNDQNKGRIKKKAKAARRKALGRYRLAILRDRRRQAVLQAEERKKNRMPTGSTTQNPDPSERPGPVPDNYLPHPVVSPNIIAPGLVSPGIQPGPSSMPTGTVAVPREPVNESDGTEAVVIENVPANEVEQPVAGLQDGQIYVPPTPEPQPQWETLGISELRRAASHRGLEGAYKEFKKGELIEWLNKNDPR